MVERDTASAISLNPMVAVRPEFLDQALKKPARPFLTTLTDLAKYLSSEAGRTGARMRFEELEEVPPDSGLSPNGARAT